MLKSLNDRYVIFLCLIPFINVFYDFSIWGFNFRDILVSSQFILLITVILFFWAHYNISFSGLTLLIVALISYLLILVPFSSDKILSLNYVLKLSLGFLFFPIGYYALFEISLLNRFLRVLPFILFFFLIYTTLANIFNWGDSFYTGQAIKTGFIGVESQFQQAIIILLYPLIMRSIKSEKFKKLYVLSIIATIIYFLLVFRRTNFIILLLGIILIVFFWNKRKQLLLPLLLLVAIMAVLVPFYYDEIIKNYEIRKSRFESFDYYLHGEGRSVESMMVLEYVSQSPINFLFGSGELFNDAGKYGFFSWEQIDLERPIHNDYARLLFGSGFIGFALYSIFLLLILKWFAKSKKYIFKHDETELLSILGITLSVIAIFIGFSSGLTTISYKSLIHILLGSFMRIISDRIKTIWGN